MIDKPITLRKRWIYLPNSMPYSTPTELTMHCSNRTHGRPNNNHTMNVTANGTTSGVTKMTNQNHATRTDGPIKRNIKRTPPMNGLASNGPQHVPWPSSMRIQL